MSHSIPVGRHTRRFACFTTFGALALTMSACQDLAAPESVAIDGPSASPVPIVQSTVSAIPDEYIVSFEDGTTDIGGRANALAKAHGADVHRTYSTALKGFSAHMSAQAAAAMRNDPNVALVEPDQVVSIASVQLGAPWGLDRIDQVSATLDGSYNYSATGTGVNAYIIDTGIRHTHTQFGGRVVPAFSVVNDAYGPDGCQWHGTHVAGVVGGTTYGVAKNVTLYSVRVTPDCTASMVISDVIAGVDWVTSNHKSPAVALLSLSTGLSLSLNTAVQNSINSGVTYAVAAGNNAGADACNYSPASTSGALTVAAITGQDAQANYSNVGACVDLYAPGTQIAAPINTDDSSIGLYSGTSQAAAFVAGAAALYLQANPSASPAQVNQAITSGATTGTVTLLTGATPNRILRVNGSGSGSTTTPPPPPPPGNTAPSAAFAVSCQKASCSFDGSSSRDDAGVVSYVWNFGDGTSMTSAGSNASHTYATKGSYSVTVTLTVKDAASLTGTAQKSVSIRNKGR